MPRILSLAAGLLVFFWIAGPAAAADSFTFVRLAIDTGGDAPEACLRFSDKLDPKPETHYGDYLKLDSGQNPAIRIDDRSLCLGGLDYATSYKVTLLKGLPSASGARLAANIPVDITLADQPPRVSVSGDGFVLSRDTADGIVIQTINVDHVRVHVLRMSDKLVTAQLSQRYSDLQNLGIEKLGRYQIRSMLRDEASVVWSGTMDVAPDHNRTVMTAFPLTGIIKPGRDGLYLVVAEDALHATPEKFFAGTGDDDDTGDGDFLYNAVPAHWVMQTDIALSAIQGSDGMHVFARSLASAEPLAKVDIRLTATGQDTLGRQFTDKNGQVVFPAGLVRGTRANAPASLVAYGPNGDFSMLNLKGPAFDLSDRGVAGRAMPAAVEAFLYAERGIYRPGETVSVTALLRDRVGNAVGDAGLTLKLRRPDGAVAKQFSLGPQPQGGFAQGVALSASASRGTWAVEAYLDPTGKPVGRVEFEVQDFVPQQLKVTLAPAIDILAPGKSIKASLDGQFLYGAPAAGLNGEADLRIMRDDTPVAGAQGYSFGLVDDKVADGEQKIDIGEADEKGHIDIDAPLDKLPETSVPLKGVLSAGLFEPSGRLVETEITLPIRSAPLLIGIHPRFANSQADEDKPADFDIRAFDAAGHAVALPGMRWNLVRENRVYDWFQSGTDWTWHYHVVDEPVADGALSVASDKPALLRRQFDWGYYRLIVSDPKTKVATSIRFHAGWASDNESADTPDKAEVSVSKPLLNPGETTQIRIKAPFAGTAQVLIASDRVFESHAVTLTKDGGTLSITASKDWGAGAYVLVTAFRPLKEGRPHDPVRAIGVAWLGLDTKPRRLNVAIAAPDKVTPRQTVDIPVKVTTADGTPASGTVYLTLAAVDEGILQLTRYASPDPLGFFFGKRRLGLDIRDIYGKLLDGTAQAGAIHQGGDEGIGGVGLPVESTRTVALFSGPVALAADGTAKVPVAVPDFEGQLRMMAVAFDATRVGAAAQPMIVRDPVIADVSLPRFLAPGDRARLALSLHNTDGAAGKYHLDVKVLGPLKLKADHTLDYDLPVGKRQADAVSVEATDAGIATVSADLTGPGGYAVHRDWSIAIRAPHYPIALAQTALQQPGETFHVDPKTAEVFVPGSLTMSLGYAGYAGLDVPSLLQSLYLYPYGCTEQMSSSAFPLIYYGDPSLLGTAPMQGGIANGNGKPQDGVAAVKARVQSAIDTILDRQGDDGQFGLWRADDGEASPWLNVYAIDFLMHAKDAGYDVPDVALTRSYTWLQGAIRQIDSNNSGYYAEAPVPTLAYAEYVLARTGRADIGLLRRLHDTISQRTIEQSSGKISGDQPAVVAKITLYDWDTGADNDRLAEPLALGHLAGALSLMGDKARARDAFAMAANNLGYHDVPRWWWYYAYYSEARDLAGLVAISAEIGDDKANATFLDRFRKAKFATADLNTQDKAWLLLAAHALNKNGKPVNLTVNGKAMTGLSLPVALTPEIDSLKSGYAVANDSDRALWRTFSLEGAPATAPPALEAGYTLTKEYFDTSGKPIDPAHLKQNDRFVVALKGNVHDEDTHRTVVVDMLPAGWEIESVIRDNDDYGFLGPLSDTRVIEARDDRFVAAFDLSPKDAPAAEKNDDEDSLEATEYAVAYLVRVVTPGHFTLPEAVVSDMYKPSLMARTAAGETVADPR